MPTCVACGKSFMFGGAKDGEVRYCSAQCRGNDFFAKFHAAMAHAATVEAQGAAAMVAQDQPVDSTAVRSARFQIEKVPPAATTAEPPLEQALAPGLDETGKDLLVVAIGVCTVLAVGTMIYFLVELIGYPFHGQTIWFVVPVGALICGFVAGAGFWVALRRLNRLPTLSTYVAAGVAGVLSYVLIYFLMWWLAEFQGARVRDHVPFTDFLQFVIEHQRLRVARVDREGFEVGKWGYARFAINVAGFALGVLTMVGVAGGKSYCPRCRRYYKDIGTQFRSTSDPETAGAALFPVIVRIQAGLLQEALELHAMFGEGKGGKGYFTTSIAVTACPGCGIHQATMTATIQGDRGAEQLEGFSYQGVSDQTLQIFP